MVAVLFDGCFPPLETLPLSVTNEKTEYQALARHFVAVGVTPLQLGVNDKDIYTENAFNSLVMNI